MAEIPANMSVPEILELLMHPVQLVEQGQVYLLLIPVYVLFIAGERVWYFFGRPGQWDDRDSIANLVITFAVLLLQILLSVSITLAGFAFFGRFSLFEVPMTGWGWLIVFLLHDLIWYTDHYIGHRMGLFWAFHSVHHSSREYNTTVASRGFLLDTLLLTRPLFFLLPVFGVSYIQFITMQLFTNLWGIAQHTRLVGKLGFLDKVFATPSNHRVHHGSDTEYLDKNYGEVLILWDRLFGTWMPERQEPVYGLTKNIESYNPARIELAGIRWLWGQIRSADRWQDKLAYLWKPPGWRHDGPGETTEELRNRAES